MKIELYPKNILETLWKEDKRWFSESKGTKPVCLRCGHSLDDQLMVNSLSRHAKIYICQNCGADEAMRDFGKTILPFEDWHGMADSRINKLPESKNPVLIKNCSFLKIFQNPKVSEKGIKGRSDTEIAYSRSDYDGYRWWTTWFRCQQEPTPKHLAKEIDQFQGALFRMPEFKTLDTMRHMCVFAEPVGNSLEEFNLYSETAHFYIWLRMLTQPRNYNLYVHYYRK